MDTETDTALKESGNELTITKILNRMDVDENSDADDPGESEKVDNNEEITNLLSDENSNDKKDEKIEITETSNENTKKNDDKEDENRKKVVENADNETIKEIVNSPKTVEDADVIDLDNAFKPPTSESSEVIDLEEPKTKSANSRCINYECKSGVEMQPAPSYCLSFYRIKVKNRKKQEVCAECMREAFDFNRKMVTCMASGGFWIDEEFPMRNELVEIVDSDEEADLTEDEKVETFFEDDDKKFINDNFVDVFNDILNTYQVEKQIKYSIEKMKAKTEKLKVEFEEVDKIINDAQKQVDSVRTELYNEFRRPIHTVSSIEIMDMPSYMIPLPIKPQTPPSKLQKSPAATPPSKIHPKSSSMSPKTPPIPTNSNVLESRDPERRSTRHVAKPASYADPPDIPEAVDDIEMMDVEPIPKTTPPKQIIAPSPDEDFQIVSEVIITKEMVPPKGMVVMPKPKIGDILYAMKQSPFGAWGRVKVVDFVHKDENSSEPLVYKVKFEAKTKSYQYRMATGKQLAFSIPSDVRLEVGTRVIAVFQDEMNIKKDNYFAGIIAEPMSTTNNYRYLIFFDDGYAQYVHHNKVLGVVESSLHVWDDIHKDSKLFIKKYLESYPERPMVKLQPGQVVKTEWSGKWWTAKVIKVDGSLVQMYFESDHRTEWIYRGSTRLGPLFLEMQAATNRQEKGPHIRRAIAQKKNIPYVEYTRSGGAEYTETPAPAPESVVARAVARKSTARTPNTIPNNLGIVSRPNTGIPFLPSQQVLQPQSKVVYFTPKTQVKPVAFKPHRCSDDCKKYITLPLIQLKGYNPLSKPLLCGWHRMLYKYKGKKLIRYRAPCGRSIRSMPECHQYLRMTKSDMSVDMFDFDYWVHCLAEFVLDKTFRSKKDISNGMEQVPIPCVNYVDNTLPDFCNYSTKREPMEGVSLNLDEEFLCGCDCEDDCSDKTKCKCWQLTIREHKSLNKRVPDELIGYSYKRLPEFVTTGIYECNAKCKCGPTCLNRVVQHPLQLKLQLFKTANRGWGIRCLNDIPQGAFICIYAGSLLTDKMANEGGVNYGDEYLAELDYIEVVEKQKDGYESDVEDIEENQSEKSRDDEEEDDEDETLFNTRNEDDDNDFVCDYQVHVPKVKSPIRTRSQRQTTETGEPHTDFVVKKEVKEEKKTSGDDDCVTISDDEDMVREPSRFDNQTEMEETEQKPKFKSVRKMFGDDEVCYIMDAKNMGNIGRYLNHSCSPNVFVQNVFVDTHDLRFPWVAFFAMNYIRAGTELTWNYNYDVGSVPGKVIFCHCGSLECRGRLL